MDAREKKERDMKIISCHGQMNYRSIAKMLGVKYHVVVYTMAKYGLKKVYKSYSSKTL